MFCFLGLENLILLMCFFLLFPPFYLFIILHWLCHIMDACGLFTSYPSVEILARLNPSVIIFVAACGFFGPQGFFNNQGLVKVEGQRVGRGRICLFCFAWFHPPPSVTMLACPGECKLRLSK